MKILIAQINPTIGDFQKNTEKILKSIKHAKELGASIVLFPEMALCGYPPEDLLLLPEFIEMAEQSLNKIIPFTQGITAIIGLPRKNSESSEKHLFNSAAVITDGKLIGYQDKVLLPTYDVFDERRYFDPGTSITVWDIAGKRIAITICEDIWQHSNLLTSTSYTRDPILEYQNHKPDLILNLSASPFHVAKSEARLKVGAKVARTLNCPLLLCNQVGGNDSLLFDGYSLVMNADGSLRQHAKGFEEEDCLVDLAESKVAILKPDDLRDLYKALVMGIRDYFHKMGFSKACLGLSGGIDSALVACIAVEALGHANVLGVAMPSRYSSSHSLTDAQALAENLKIQFLEVPIEDPFKSFLELLTPHFGGKGPDHTEENLQARIRGMILMAFSNKLGYIVLSTGNKSELAMGYSTLYGDMCGGLAILSDVTKDQVYKLADWINRKKEIIPHNTIIKEPSAELRPNQKDSDSLPPYSIIDNVVRDYVEEHKSPKDIANKYDYPIEIVRDLIGRIHQNEYKRRQSPPGLRVSEKAFSIGRRFPIVQKWD
jgi:NAD+ synthase (glutamine-hydrolysing)